MEENSFQSAKKQVEKKMTVSIYKLFNKFITNYILLVQRLYANWRLLLETLTLVCLCVG